MSRTALRLAGVATALAVAVTVVPASTGTAGAAAPDQQGVDVGGSTVSSELGAAGGLSATPSFRAQWPVGRRTGNLTVHPEGSTGAPAQTLTSVTVEQVRARSTMAAVVKLGAAPTAATSSLIIVAFGFVTPDGLTCDSPAGHNVGFTSTDTDTQNNPVYAGATITVRPFQLAAARNAAWNCAFAQVLSLDRTTKYDSVAGGLTSYRQTPNLSIATKGRTLKGRGYTKVPITIRNSAATIATAPRVRLSWKTQGVVVRAKRNVGTIRPGAGKRGFFYVKDTARGNGKIVFTVRSRTYSRKLTLVVRETRR